MSRSLKLTVAVLVVFVGMQLVPVSRENPPVEEVVSAPPEVIQILERACYDCHSHESVWPWYARVAPVSWLVAYDVAEAREHLNFSTWNRYDEEERRENLEEIWEEVEEGDMPLPIYPPLHPEAKLSADDLKRIEDWAAAGD